MHYEIARLGFYLLGRAAQVELVYGKPFTFTYLLEMGPTLLLSFTTQTLILNKRKNQQQHNTNNCTPKVSIFSQKHSSPMLCVIAVSEAMDLSRKGMWV